MPYRYVEPADSTADSAAMLQSLAEAEKRLTQRGQEVPQWIVESGIPIRYDTCHAQWQIQIKAQVRITEIATYGWVAKIEGAKHCSVLFWLPLTKDGSFQTTQLRVAEGNMPHCTQGGSCLALGDAPTRIDSWKSYCAFVRSLERGLSQINLGSLYNLLKSSWPKEVRLAIPAEVRKKIGRHRMGYLSRATLEKYFTQQTQGEEETTWTTASTLASNH